MILMVFHGACYFFAFISNSGNPIRRLAVGFMCRLDILPIMLCNQTIEIAAEEKQIAPEESFQAQRSDD
jgi:hypothetical protein